MIFCTQCGTSMRESQKYCWNCGSKADGPATIVTPPASRFAAAPPQNAGVPGRNFCQAFGLDPRVAFLTLIVDVMLNAGDVASLGLLLPVSIGAGIVLGYIVYRAQIGWYGDDPESAKIKAIILGLLTAIPTPLPELLYVPAGVIGLLHGFRRKALHQ
ncbi:MAG TPA: zinc ribbon domain-containing protein [Bryobacteraceae bacterium]|nr:zinc ribbon domain-containing protein [Bryobacteraceae bacterium]